MRLEAAIILTAILLTTFQTTPIHASNNLGFNQYLKYSDLTIILKSFNETFKNYISLFSIGKSFHGRDIWCVAITNKSLTTFKEEILILSHHHARELITYMPSIYLIYHLASNAERYSYIVNSRIIYVTPSVSPDGY
jgi:murein tripeptide amidase MpaA